LKQIEKFQPSTRSDRFASFIGSIYRQFEEVEDEYCTEQEVKDYVKKAYLKFQKYKMILMNDFINFLIEAWTNYWQSVIVSITDIRSPAYTWFFLWIFIKIYREFFLNRS
jgi:hypothetical protein